MTGIGRQRPAGRTSSCSADVAECGRQAPRPELRIPMPQAGEGEFSLDDSAFRAQQFVPLINNDAPHAAESITGVGVRKHERETLGCCDQRGGQAIVPLASAGRGVSGSELHAPRKPQVGDGEKRLRGVVREGSKRRDPQDAKWRRSAGAFSGGRQVSRASCSSRLGRNSGLSARYSMRGPSPDGVRLAHPRLCMHESAPAGEISRPGVALEFECAQPLKPSLHQIQFASAGPLVFRV